MKRTHTFAGMIFVLCFAAALACFGLGSASAEADLSLKTYVPEAADFLNYWGGASDLSPEDGDGVYTFAHASFVVPMKGDEIRMNTLFKLLSKKTVEEGGDNVDGWLTYSFSNEPGVDGKDNSFPFNGGLKTGYFLHITNYSGTTAPNCVEVQVVKNTDGVCETFHTFFLDNALNVPLTLELTKGEDGFYDLTFTRIDDGTVLGSQEDLALDETLFVNEQGQTFFSTAIYEGPGCDEQHWEHRGMAIFSAEVYTKDASAAEITLTPESMEYTEGTTSYKPEVTVKVGSETLSDNEDYYVLFSDNTGVGTASATVIFIGDYAGNTSMVKEFEITEATTPGPGDSSDPENPDKDPDKKGCGSEIFAGSALIAVLALGGSCLLKKRS